MTRDTAVSTPKPPFASDKVHPRPRDLRSEQVDSVPATVLASFPIIQPGATARRSAPASSTGPTWSRTAPPASCFRR